ncbi:MAG TPA: hypothetical protein VFR86_12200 [Burkholderiaceae bacterium]|nr:hypothetical protein [Burkholderiaceae bacterium]
MALFRALLILFAIVVIGCAIQFWRTGDRRYLRWAGRLFAGGIVTALIFFAMLAIQQFT